jgi:hypothetical protein
MLFVMCSMAEEATAALLEDQEGSNPVPIILGIVGSLVVIFFAGRCGAGGLWGLFGMREVCSWLLTCPTLYSAATGRCTRNGQFGRTARHKTPVSSVNG